jgi:UDP-GlcNAc3NAcA epimerase
LTDRISDILFCPTIAALENLKKEGYDNINTQVILSGDVMQDASLLYGNFSRKPKVNISEAFILCTIHRAENADNVERLASIFKALNTIAIETSIVLPLHPRTKSKIKEYNINIGANIFIIDPVGYLEIIYLFKNCQLVITDSGGVQKESFFFKKFCITLRDETEWNELVENNFNIIVGADEQKIIRAFKQEKKEVDFNMNLYGNGKASKKIVNKLWEKRSG